MTHGKKDFFGNSRFADGSHDKVKAFARPFRKGRAKALMRREEFMRASIAAHGKTGREVYLSGRTSHNHRLSRWLAQPYKGMVLAGLKAL